MEGGKITRMQTADADVKLDAGIVVYNSSDGGDGGVPSGAYIFRWHLSLLAMGRVEGVSGVNF